MSSLGIFELQCTFTYCLVTCFFVYVFVRYVFRIPFSIFSVKKHIDTDPQTHVCLSKVFFTYCCVCWCENITKRDINRITGIIENSGYLIQSNEHSDYCVYYKIPFNTNFRPFKKIRTALYIMSYRNTLLLEVAE